MRALQGTHSSATAASTEMVTAVEATVTATEQKVVLRATTAILAAKLADMIALRTATVAQTRMLEAMAVMIGAIAAHTGMLVTMSTGTPHKNVWTDLLVGITSACWNSNPGWVDDSFYGDNERKDAG